MMASDNVSTSEELTQAILQRADSRREFSQEVDFLALPLMCVLLALGLGLSAWLRPEYLTELWAASGMAWGLWIKRGRE